MALRGNLWTHIQYDLEPFQTTAFQVKPCSISLIDLVFIITGDLQNFYLQLEDYSCSWWVTTIGNYAQYIKNKYEKSCYAAPSVHQWATQVNSGVSHLLEGRWSVDTLLSSALCLLKPCYSRTCAHSVWEINLAGTVGALCSTQGY